MQRINKYSNHKSNKITTSSIHKYDQNLLWFIAQYTKKEVLFTIQSTLSANVKIKWSNCLFEGNECNVILIGMKIFQSLIQAVNSISFLSSLFALFLLFAYFLSFNSISLPSFLRCADCFVYFLFAILIELYMLLFLNIIHVTCSLT